MSVIQADLDALKRELAEFEGDVRSELADRARASLSAAGDVVRMTEALRRVHDFANRITHMLAEVSRIREEAELAAAAAGGKT